MFFERKAARLLGCRLEPVLFNPHIRALHTTTWGISTLKRLLQHTIWHKKTGSVQLTNSLIKIYQVEIVIVKSDRKTLWALQRSCNDQRSAKLTVSSEEGKLIAIWQQWAQAHQCEACHQEVPQDGQSIYCKRRVNNAFLNIFEHFQFLKYSIVVMFPANFSLVLQNTIKPVKRNGSWPFDALTRT